MKAGEHGPDELYNKFTVVKTKDVTQWGQLKEFAPEDELTGKDEFIFVLRPETNDKAAIAALDYYAHMIKDAYPQLAEHIKKELERIQRDFPEGNPALRKHG
jgi:hypothetical protein